MHEVGRPPGLGLLIGRPAAKNSLQARPGRHLKAAAKGGPARRMQSRPGLAA